jgi:snurportin-1
MPTAHNKACSQIKLACVFPRRVELAHDVITFFVFLCKTFCNFTDILRWRSRDIEDCTSEFRLYWAASQLKEDLDTTPEVLSPLTSVRHFATLPVFPATPAGIRSAYSGPVPFTRDGLYFVHRSAMYQCGQTPLALVWKDPHCSRYFVDTDPSGVPLREQHMILKYCQDRSVVTSDDQPVALAVMPESFVKEVGPSRLSAGSLLRFRIGPRGISFASDGSPVGADLHFLGFASQQRGRADSLSKVVFQYMARAGPLKIETLLAVATTSEHAGAAWLGEGKMSSIGVDRGQAGLQEENLAGMAIG